MTAETTIDFEFLIIKSKLNRFVIDVKIKDIFIVIKVLST
jgi:hypothetical protein